MPDYEEFNKIDATITQSETPRLSKKEQKRQLKRKRWEETKDERKAKLKAKQKAKKEVLRSSGVPTKKKLKVQSQEESGIRIVIDCAFDELMTEKVRFRSKLFFDSF
jgi:tRNA (guanine9-N1)-methyltransferase